MKPVYGRILFGGHGVRVRVFGATRNWNFAGDNAAAIEAGNPGITEAIVDLLAEEASTSEIDVRAFVPKPSFNAQIVSERNLRDERLPRFYRGADADGVSLINRGDTYMLASADCLCAVLFDERRNIAVAAHCGRDALIDREYLAMKSQRRFASVIDAAVLFFRQHAGGGLFDPSSLRVFLAAGIGPKTFTHPTTPMAWDAEGVLQVNKYQAANLAMIDFLERKYPGVVTDYDQGCIDLVALVTAQLSEYGVPPEHIAWDGVNTALDTDAEGNFLFHSNRRDKTQRNLVAVTLL